MASEAVKVIVRCRPMNNREKSLNSKSVVFMQPGSYQCSIVNPSDSSAPPKSFSFDGVYHVDSTTEIIYNDIAYPLVEGVLEGYNGTVFAYGQTGCGKSFTMQGIQNPTCHRGIIPRAFEHIFEAISTAENMKYLVYASYLEIYNEEIRDLLGKDCKKKLDLKEHPDRGVYVSDLSQHPVHNVCECEALMDSGWGNRAVGATLMNADSSRSHSIFTINLEMMKIAECDNECDNECETIRNGKLNLVDLAGSERQAKTGATGDRLKEATKINLSLSALGNVISALVDGKSKHIPYRDSKLTRLLQDSLGGNTKTLMVACVSPADNNYDETLSTLRYANRAKNIKNKPKINEDAKDTLLREYQEEIKKLKDLLESQTSTEQIIPVTTIVPDEKAIEEEKRKMREEYEEHMKTMKEQYEAEQQSNARLQADMEKLRAQYEAEVKNINNKPKPDQVLTNGHTEVEEINLSSKEEVENLKNTENLDAMQKEALARLQRLEEIMVGGEKAHDNELKEKRQKKKKAAERRLRALADVLSTKEDTDDSDAVLLRVYDNIQEELRVKNEALKKYKQKNKALEIEISDLTSEFQNDRTDYLETIRRQDQQIKLISQLLEKVHPTIRKDCNYSNLDKIKQEALWSDDKQQWKLPDLIIMKTRLPPAENRRSAGSLAPVAKTNGTAKPTSPARSYHSCPNDSATSDPEEAPDDKFRQKLERSEREDIAGNYFKPKRATMLLTKAQEDACRVVSKWKDFATGSQRNRVSNNTNNHLSSSLSPNGFQSLNGLNLSGSLGNNGLISSSWSNVATNGSSINRGAWFVDDFNPKLSPNRRGKMELTRETNGNGLAITSPDMRKPVRLEALPALDKKLTRKKNKPELHTMDVI